MVRRILLGLGCLLVMGAGCASDDFGRDPLSAGSAKILLEKGKTTPDEVMRAFGGPNVVYGNADGRETWTYDRMAYVTSSASVGGAAAGGGAGGTGGVGGLLWGRASRSASSSRTVTLFLVWQDGILDDFEYRSSIY